MIAKLSGSPFVLACRPLPAFSRTCRTYRRPYSFDMTPEEQNLISSLFDRLRQASNQPKDAEADQLIRSKVAELPSPPYPLLHTPLLIPHPLSNAQTPLPT